MLKSKLDSSVDSDRSATSFHADNDYDKDVINQENNKNNNSIKGLNHTDNAFYIDNIGGYGAFTHRPINMWVPSIFSPNQLSGYSPMHVDAHSAANDNVHFKPSYLNIINSMAVAQQQTTSTPSNPAPAQEQEQSLIGRTKIFGNLSFKIGPLNFKINTGGSFKTTSATIGFKLGPFDTTMKIGNTPPMPKPDASYDFEFGGVAGQINVAVPKPPAPPEPNVTHPGATPGINPYPVPIYVPVPVPYYDGFSGHCMCCCHFHHHAPRIPGFEPIPIARQHFISLSQAAKNFARDIPIVEKYLIDKMHNTALTEREVAMLRVIESPAPVAMLQTLKDGGVERIDVSGRDMSTAFSRVYNTLSSGHKTLKSKNLPEPDLAPYYARGEQEHLMQSQQCQQDQEAELDYAYE